ncbi:MAG: GDSL-type esterase/lipase family protein, partial [Paracoccaceae bacterium]
GTAPMRDLEDSPILARGDRWGDQMASILGSDFEVIVEGLPGRTTVFDDPVEGEHLNGLRVLPAILHSHKPIDLLIIALGTNDQKQKFGLGAIDIALGVTRLIREAHASGVVAKSLAICPPPLEICGELGDIFQGGPERAADLPRLMERSVKRDGAAFFNAGQHICVDPLDGVHWNEEAHATLAREVAKLVPQLLS